MDALMTMASYTVYSNSSDPPPVTADVSNATARVSNWPSYTEAMVGRFLIVYIYPVVIATGTVGNVLSFLVLIRRPMRDTSVYFYLAMLAVADLLVLYVSGLRTWTRQVFDVELLHTSHAACKALMLLFLVSLHMSAWLVVAMTVDRFVAVWFPFKASEVCATRRARLLCAASFLVVLLYNAHVLFTIDLHDLGHRMHCGPMWDNYFMTTIFPTMKLVSYSFLPFSLVLLFNAAIIFKLWLSQSFLRGSRIEGAQRASSMSGARGGGGCGGGGGVNSSAQQHKITVMLLIVSFVWLVLTGPFTLEPLVRTRGRDDPSIARLYLSKSVCFLLLYTNHSINFYIYCVTGRKFRQQLLDTLCACAKRQRATHGRLQSRIDSRTTKTNVNHAGRSSVYHNGEAVPLKKMVVVSYNETT